MTTNDGTECGTCADCQCDDCCTGIAVVTPVSVANRPGRPTLDYRVGTHPQFLATMHARLGSADLPGLAKLTTREHSDFSLALLDGWATIADVLSFYTERIANEGFLRTATEEFSVRRLAELVGYRPRPGLAASAYLAFTVNAGQTVPIPIGTKAQQVPPPSQLPATFETAESLVGYGNLSTLAIRRIQPPVITELNLDTTTSLAFDGNLPDLRSGDRLAVRVPGALGIFAVTEVELDAAGNRTTAWVELEHRKPPIPPDDPEEVVTPAAPIIREGKQETRLQQLVSSLRKPPSQPPGDAADLGRELRDLFGADKGGVTALLDDVVPELAGVLDQALAQSSAKAAGAPVITQMMQSAMLFGATAPKYPTSNEGVVNGYVDPKRTKLPIYVDGQPPREEAEPEYEMHPAIDPPLYVSSTTLDLDGVYPAITADSDIVLINTTLPADYKSTFDSPVFVRRVEHVTTVTPNVLGMSAKVTRLTLDAAWPIEHDDDDDDDDDGGDPDLELHAVLDDTVVLAHPKLLTLAGESLDDIDIGCLPEDCGAKQSTTLLPDSGESSSACGDTLELDGLYPELKPGRWLIVSGERTDEAIKSAQDPDVSGSGPTGVHGTELVMVAATEHRTARIPASDEGQAGQGQTTLVDLPGDTVHTFVRLAAPLAYTYLRPSVVVYGNVARATHGETRYEVLGSGDPAKPFARFPLKQPPLTYLPAATAAGARSTLDVFVDAVRWHEADSLLGIGANDRGYVIETDDDGKSAVVFGASRPPSGVENIRAQYRSGIGRPGNAPAGTLTTPLDQPLGVTAVTNPLPATGGADRDERETVRRNAAVSVQALDRLVSVSDYADFATAFAGIGAAVARELSDGRRLVVHVTIAGIDDAPIAPTSDLTSNLRDALLQLGDPAQEVQVDVRALKALVVSARVGIDPGRRWPDVEAALRTKLLSTFGPGRRTIGQGVAQSEVLAAMHSVPGVGYANLTILDALGEANLVSEDPVGELEDETKKKQQPLPLVRAELARFDPGATPGTGAMLPAELIVLIPSAPDTLILEAI